MSITNKIVSCMERSRCFGVDYKISDFQLRIVGEDLTLVNLRNGHVEVINDAGDDCFEDVEKIAPYEHCLGTRSICKPRRR